MKQFSVQRFKCETCGHVYETAAEAVKCETKPVTQDKDVKIGDTIRIVRGEGQGLAKVEERFIIDKDWGHYAWERYWHTVGLSAKCIDAGWGHRMLTFDDYEVIPPASTTTQGKP